MRCRSLVWLLNRLGTGTDVSIWFDASGFLATTYQFALDDESVFSGGALGGGLTYVRGNDILAVGLPAPWAGGGPSPAPDADPLCPAAMRILGQLAPGTAVSFWLDASGFVSTTFSFAFDNVVAFSGGAFSGFSRVYVRADAIVALRVGTGTVASSPIAPAGARSADGAVGGVWGRPSHGYGGGDDAVMAILRELAPGTAVSVWFDNSGYLTAAFQALADNEAVFTGGDLDGGVTYIKASSILSVRVGGDATPDASA